jgi:Skp family chaperone for outer membrane proteins
MKYVKLYEEFLNEKKPAGAPDWKDSDAPDAEGRFRDLGIKDLAAWLIKTRNKDLKKISGSLTQQIVFNRKEDPAYADKMEKVRKEVYKQLDREDLMEGMNYDELVDDVVMKYNPALFSGEYTDLSNEERDLIKDMLKMYAKGHSTKEIAKKFTGKETELMNAAKVYTDDLIKRSLPQ